MVLPPRTNFGRSGVTSSIASTDTSISVTDASVFSDPANGSFNVVIFDAGAGPSPSQVGSGSREIVTVTGRDTTNDTLTVTRGAEGTTATSLPDTSVVIEAATGGDFGAVDTALESMASYSAGTADHLTAQVGTSSNRQDVFGGSVDAQSVSTDGPVEMSSAYGSFQAALDAAGGGLLIVNDTKTEESIQIDTSHSDTTVWFVGANQIEQPASPTAGEAVMRAADGLSSDVTDMTFVDLRITNPSNADSDIQNNDTLTQSDRTSGFEWDAPIASNVTASPVRFEFIRPHIDHVNGHGLAVQRPSDRLTCRDGYVSQTAYDGFYYQAFDSTADGVTVVIEDCYAEDNGRLNFTAEGDPCEDSVVISGVGKRSYVGSLDIEEAQNVDIDLDIHAPNQSGGTSPDYVSGVHVSTNSKQVSGEARIHDANWRSATISGRVDGLHLIVRQPVGDTGSTEIQTENTATGKFSANIVGGGNDTGVVDMKDTKGMHAVIEAEGAYGPAVRLNGAQKCIVEVIAKEVCQGAANVPNIRRANVALDTPGREASRSPDDNDIKLVARDLDGNVRDGVGSDGGDYNRFSGNIRNAYSNVATNIGSNSDVSDLIS